MTAAIDFDLFGIVEAPEFRQSTPYLRALPAYDQGVVRYIEDRYAQGDRPVIEGLYGSPGQYACEKWCVPAEHIKAINKHFGLDG